MNRPISGRKSAFRLRRATVSARFSACQSGHLCHPPNVRKPIREEHRYGRSRSTSLRPGRARENLLRHDRRRLRRGQQSPDPPPSVGSWASLTSPRPARGPPASARKPSSTPSAWTSRTSRAPPNPSRSRRTALPRPTCCPPTLPSAPPPPTPTPCSCASKTRPPTLPP